MLYVYEVFFNHFMNYSLARQSAIVLLALTGGISWDRFFVVWRKRPYHRVKGWIAKILAVFLFASALISLKYLYFSAGTIQTTQAFVGSLLIPLLLLAAYILCRREG